MVNTGKPSSGCNTCKKRKIKCDERRPFCQRCEKASRVCPGVPDSKVLEFRNKFADTRIESPPKWIEEPRRSSSADESYYQWSQDNGLCPCSDCRLLQASPEDSQNQELRGLVPQPEYPIECQAVALFMNDFQGAHFLPKDPRLMVKPILFTRQIYVSALQYEAIHPATAAPAIGLFAAYSRRLDLRVWAIRKCGEAINMIQQALSDPDSALTDGTLQGIAILKLFEGTNMSLQDLRAYYTHNEGLKAVVKRRGARNFTTPFAVQLFRAYRTVLVMATLEAKETSEPLDYSDPSFDWFADRDIPDETEINTRLIRIGYQLGWTRFRVDTALMNEEPGLEQDMVFLSLLEQLQSLDIQLDEWFAELPDDWRPTVTAVSPDRVDVWNRVIHSYSDRILAGILIMAYVMRAIIHDNIMHLSIRVGRSPPTCSRYAVRSAVDAFCAALPWLLGCETPGDNNPGVHNSGVTPMNWLRAGLSVSMKWVPTIAGLSHYVPSTQRQWLRDRLEFAAKRANYALARILAQRIKV